MKPSALQCKQVTEVDFKTSYNLKQKSDLIIGDEARQFIRDEKKNNLKEERLEEFYTAVQKFYKVSCDYIKKKLPLSCELLKHAEVANPKKQQDTHFSSLEYISSLDFPSSCTQRQVCQPSSLNLQNTKVQTSGVASVAQAGWMLPGGRSAN